MEDSVVRKTMLVAMTTACCAVGTVVNAAEEGSSWSPKNAVMAPWNWATGKSKEKTPDQGAAAITQPKPAEPSAEISPYKHPIKYMGAAMSETPVAKAMGFGKQSPEEAAKVKTDAIALSTPTGPPSPQLVVSLAEMSERKGNAVEARQQLRQAMVAWPNDVEVIRAAARLEDRQNELQAAEELYRKAIATNPQHAGAYNDLGLCLARQGKFDDSVLAIEQAIHLQPDKPLYRNNVATVLVEMKQDQRALAHLAAVHGLAEANYNLGQLLVQRGRSTEAMSYFQVALAQNPSLKQAQTSIAMLQRSSAVASAKPATAYSPQPQVATQGTAQPAAYPAAVPASTPAGGAAPYVPDRYSSPVGPGTPSNDYRANLPRHLPPVDSGNGTWIQ
jgi:tetratricopeptide (TPR) repeat protein